MKPDGKTAPTTAFACVFGLFLGLCTWKFGNPVILDHIIGTPATFQDFVSDAWPTHWADWLLVPLTAWGIILLLQREPTREPAPVRWKWLWALPLAWFACQVAAATQTVAGSLTIDTLWQFAGCLACYFFGVHIFSRDRLWRWLLIGVLAAFAFTLVRGVDQRIFEYPQNYQALTEGERVGWTNFPPAAVTEMKREGLIVTTNGLDVANPVILGKFARGRVSGTLVYPNALAQIILLLWPVSLALAFLATRQLRPLVRYAAITMTVFLGAAAFFWTGSKLAWLLAIGLAGIALLRLDWSKKLKIAAVAGVLVVGLGVFAIRFHHYFAAGATSAGARFDYWRAALQITAAHPWLGTGPGTFGQLYSQIKAPDSEMARLAHNDFLEQFCDAGIPTGVLYAAWIILALWTIISKVWPKEPAGPASGWEKAANFALFLGVLGWFAQGLGEFGLYVPALGWTAFTLLGCLIGPKGSQPGSAQPLPRTRP